MTTDIRDELMKTLTGAGLYVVKRDWAMGNTIIVSRGLKDEGDGIKSFNGYVCMYPLDGGRWGLNVSGVNAEKYDVASDAVLRTINILKLDDLSYDQLVKKFHRAISDARKSQPNQSVKGS